MSKRVRTKLQSTVTPGPKYWSISPPGSAWIEVKTGKTVTCVWFIDTLGTYRTATDHDVKFVKSLLELTPTILKRRRLVERVLQPDLKTQASQYCLSITDETTGEFDETTKETK